MQGKYRGPMHGIPFGAKDTYYTQGIRTTAGSYALRGMKHPRFLATHWKRIVGSVKQQAMKQAASL